MFGIHDVEEGSVGATGLGSCHLEDVSPSAALSHRHLVDNQHLLWKNQQHRSQEAPSDFSPTYTPWWSNLGILQTFFLETKEGSFGTRR